MYSVKKGASNCLQQIRRSTVRTNVAKKSTSAINIDQKLVNKDEEAIDHNTAFSNTISFSSPESDFCTPHILIKSNFKDLDNEDVIHSTAKEVPAETASVPDFSGTLSFTSPESDFTSGSMMKRQKEEETSQEVVKNNENEIKVAKDTFFQNVEGSKIKQEDIAYSLSFASAESDFTNPEFMDMLNERQKNQLRNTNLLHDDANQLSSIVNRREVDRTEAENHPVHAFQENKDVVDEYQELRAHADLLSHEDPLPTNMEEAMVTDDDRAIVITEAAVPFKIVTVNSAWEHLCGYTKDECNGQTLKCIQGPETNQAAITALMSQLLRGEEAGTVLVNYKKDGSKFLNRLRVGTLRDDNNSITHFVGVLKEVKEMTDQFNGASKILVQD